MVPHYKYPDLIEEDYKIRKFFKENYDHADISGVEIERVGNKMNIFVYTAFPGVLIGKKGSEVNKIREGLQKLTGGKYKELNVSIREIKEPDLDAQLAAQRIAKQIERRVSYKRAMKQARYKAMRSGAKGVKVLVAGRLGGAEIARDEWFLDGRMPLSTLRSDIDYGFAEAVTKYGVIGVHVWIYKGDVTDFKELLPPRGMEISSRRRGRRRG
jgi:small subunit ribosomal protein S3